jgi:T-complex protein 1 subunit beta
LDMKNGGIGNMWEMGIRESFKSKLQVDELSSLLLLHTFTLSLSVQVLVSAAEAAEMILRVDDIIKCAPRQRE